MSTHTIGFYEEITKIIFQLSSNTHFICTSVYFSRHIGIYKQLIIQVHKNAVFYMLYENSSRSYIIMKTYPFNVCPLTTHFYIVKLGFTEVYFFSYFCSKT